MDVTITNKCNNDLWAITKDEMLNHSTELSHYFNRIEEVEVVVSEGRHDHKHVFNVDIHVNCEHNHDIVVSSESEEGVSSAFHKAWHMAKRQLRKHKEKIQAHH